MWLYLTILVFYFIYILDLIPSSMEVGGLTFKCMLPSSKNLFLSSYFPIQYPRSLFSDILGILRMVFLVTMLKFWILTSNESYHSNHRYLWCILIWRCSTRVMCDAVVRVANICHDLCHEQRGYDLVTCPAMIPSTQQTRAKQ